MKIRRDGFTLYELLLVIVVIGILSAIPFPVMMRARIKSYETTASSDIGQLTAAIRMYAEDWGRYPPGEDHIGGDCSILIEALESDKYLEYPASKKDSLGNLLDPWGLKYQYYFKTDGTVLRGKVPYNLWSIGKNRVDDTVAGNEVDDIGNW